MPRVNHSERDGAHVAVALAVDLLDPSLLTHHEAGSGHNVVMSPDQQSWWCTFSDLIIDNNILTREYLLFRLQKTCCW
jgi:hypothetical protein